MAEFLSYVCNHEMTTTVKKMNMFIIPRNFLMPCGIHPSSLLPPSPSLGITDLFSITMN